MCGRRSGYPLYRGGIESEVGLALYSLQADVQVKSRDSPRHFFWSGIHYLLYQLVYIGQLRALPSLFYCSFDLPYLDLERLPKHQQITSFLQRQTFFQQTYRVLLTSGNLCNTIYKPI